MTRDRFSPFGLMSRERRRHPPFAAPLQGAMSETVPIPPTATPWEPDLPEEDLADL
jgi:hypothetical protein